MQNGVVLRHVDAEIAAAHVQLAELDQRREVVARRLVDLNRLRAAGSADAPIASGTELPAASKIELFRDLFRGRQDVFAVRWENRPKGRGGYSPRCSNEWKPGVCHKPKVRCGSCTNQAFVSLGDRELLAHLQGRVVLGIYPLLPDDTCRLLAIDLDGASWRADARAIRETCLSLELEPTVERSRSGNGGHVWLFFTDSVAAADARRLGFYILTETMARGAALSVASYDRLFPSQDVLPNGGFQPHCAAASAGGSQARQHRVLERRARTTWRPMVVPHLGTEDRSGSPRRTDRGFKCGPRTRGPHRDGRSRTPMAPLSDARRSAARHTDA
jgi:hypothetical protein